LELFNYDFATEEFSQVSEPTGGIGSRPGGCPSYRPFVSSDGGGVLFLFPPSTSAVRPGFARRRRRGGRRSR